MEALLLALGKSIYYVRTGVTKRPYSIHPLFIFYYQLLTLKVGKQYQGVGYFHMTRTKILM